MDWKFCYLVMDLLVCSHDTLLCFCAHSRGEDEDHDLYKSKRSIVGLADACKYVYNDAKFVNERARNDIFLLSR